MIPDMQNIQAPKAAGAGFIFDVDAHDFEEKVLKASMQKPVIIDFWAPWCGPCKQLMPLLESAVNGAGGKILLAKVNIDNNQEIAQAFKVQSVPTVFAIFQGQPVTAFNGLKPQSEIDEFLTQLVTLADQNSPEAMNTEELLKKAEELIAEKDFQNAYMIYRQILTQDNTNIDANCGLMQVMLETGQAEEVEKIFNSLPTEILNDPKFEPVKKTLEMIKNTPDEKEFMALIDKVHKNENDHSSRFDLSLAYFGAGKKEAAIDELIEIIRRDSSWENEKARKKLLEFFDIIGLMDPVVVAGRKKLSSILFT